MFKVGDIVISKAGHDEGRLYVVTALKSGDFILLCDGKYRKLAKPKTKRVRHVKKIAESEKVIGLAPDGGLSDADIVHELKVISLSLKTKQQ